MLHVEVVELCGIFGFVLARPVPLAQVFSVLEKLEAHQYPQEPKPVGGYGAGLAIIRNNRGILLEKVGRTKDSSPARSLSKLVKVKEASVLIGHVRMPSPQFMTTAQLKETTQPYAAKCHQGLTVISAHNGYITNYIEIREKLGKSHVLESDNVELIDSEVIPHYFEEILKSEPNVKKGIDVLHSTLEGSMALSILQVGNGASFLHLIHKGKTRGLTVWTNKNDETVFCSRKEPLTAEFRDILADRVFVEKTSIGWREERNFILSVPINM